MESMVKLPRIAGERQFAFVPHLLCIFLIAGCGSSGDSETSAGDTMIEDGDDMLAALSFQTAEHDARFTCLLGALESEAMTAELDVTNVVDEVGEMSRSWCSDRMADGNACARGALDALTTVDVRALSIWARRADGADDVSSYGLRAVRNPASNGTSQEPAWSLFFERSFGESDGFQARFVPFEEEGINFDGQLSVFDRAGYRAEGVTVTYPMESATELLSKLTESPDRLESELVLRYDTLLSDFETEIANEALDIDTETRDRAIVDAREFFGVRRALVTQHAVSLHALLSEQVALDRCGG